MKTQVGAYAGWGADDSYLGYIRLKPGVVPEQINQKIPALLPKYIDVERERKQGFEMELYIKPVSEIYTQSTGFRFVIRGGDELYLELGIFSADPGEIRRSTQM